MLGDAGVKSGHRTFFISFLFPQNKKPLATKCCEGFSIAGTRFKPATAEQLRFEKIKRFGR
jgi:hypothetical protein